MPSIRLIAASVGLLVVGTGGALVAGRAAGPPESDAVGHAAEVLAAQGAAHPAHGQVSSGAKGSGSAKGASRSGDTNSDPDSSAVGNEVEHDGTLGSEVEHDGTTGQKAHRLIKRDPPALPGATNVGKADHQRAGTVTGYPRRVVPAVPGTTSLTTSVSPGGDRLQAALTGSVDQSADAVFRFYRARLTSLGFIEVSSPAVAGSTATGFARGDSSVVVTTTPGHGLAYSVFAVLRVDGS